MENRDRKNGKGNGKNGGPKGPKYVNTNFERGASDGDFMINEISRLERLALDVSREISLLDRAKINSLGVGAPSSSRRQSTSGGQSSPAQSEAPIDLGLAPLKAQSPVQLVPVLSPILTSPPLTSSVPASATLAPVITSNNNKKESKKEKTGKKKDQDVPAAASSSEPSSEKATPKKGKDTKQPPAHAPMMDLGLGLAPLLPVSSLPRPAPATTSLTATAAPPMLVLQEKATPKVLKREPKGEERQREYERDNRRGDQRPPQREQRDRAQDREGQKGGEAKKRTGKRRYEDYWDSELIRQGLEEGFLVQGEMRINPTRRFEGYVDIKGLTHSIYVDGEIARNRAFEGDIVAIMLLPEKDWRDKSKAVAEDEEEEDERDKEKEDMLSNIITGTATTEEIMAELQKAAEVSASKAASRGSSPPASPPLAPAAPERDEADWEDVEGEEEEETAVTASKSEEKKSLEKEKKESGKEGDKSAEKQKRKFFSTKVELTKEEMKQLVEKAKSNQSMQAVGKVVGVIEKNHQPIHVGHIRPSSDDGVFRAADKVVFFVPLDRKWPRMMIGRRSLPKSLDIQLFKDASKEAAPPRNKKGGDAAAADANKMNRGRMSDDRNLHVVKCIEWDAYAQMPWASYERFLGEAGTIEVDSEAILIDNGVNFPDFSPAVLSCLKKFEAYPGQIFMQSQSNPKLDNMVNADGRAAASRAQQPPPPAVTRSEWQVPKEEMARRVDLRDKCIFSIDPPTAKDLDDALSIELQEDGTYEVGVHIADVSYFIEPNTALDLEAKNRSTTVYLVHKAITMLPPLLCENLCSLNPCVDRLAFSAFWHMTEDGKIVEDKEPRFARTVIRSCAKLTYDMAQDVIDGKVTEENAADKLPIGLKVKNPWQSPDEPRERGMTPEETRAMSLRVVRDIKLLHKVAMARRKNRFDGGAVQLQRGTKLSFKLDPATRMPLDVWTYEIKESNNLVEEYMLLANHLVAKHIAMWCRDVALLRCHAPPSARQLQNFATLCERVGHKPQEELTPDNFYANLCAMRDAASSEIVAEVLEYLATRFMNTARYFCTGATEDVSEWKHYALNLDFYTHFTSPIRRYPDVMVHRLLAFAIENEGKEFQTPPFTDTERLQSICKHSNERKKASKHAQMDCDQLFLCFLLKKMHEEQEKVSIEISTSEDGKTTAQATSAAAMSSANPNKVGSFLVEEDAVVLSVKDRCLEVLVRKFGIESRVYFEDCDGTKVIEYQESSHSCTVEWTRNDKTTEVTYRVFDQLRVRLRAREEKIPMDVSILLCPPAVAVPASS